MLIQYSLLVLIAPQRSKCCRESVQSGGLEDESYHGQEPRQECLQDISSDVNGSFVSSCIECQDKLDNLRPGTDIHLRDHARLCLKENLGWIDSAGKLVQEEYPRVLSLLKRLRRTNWSAPGSRLFLFQTPSPTIPEPQAVAELERSKLNTDTREEGAAASASDKTGTGILPNQLLEKDDRVVYGWTVRLHVNMRSVNCIFLWRPQVHNLTITDITDAGRFFLRQISSLA
jgi:hypothetical protein